MYEVHYNTVVTNVSEIVNRILVSLNQHYYQDDDNDDNDDFMERQQPIHKYWICPTEMDLFYLLRKSLEIEITLFPPKPIIQQLRRIVQTQSSSSLLSTSSSSPYFLRSHNHDNDNIDNDDDPNQSLYDLISHFYQLKYTKLCIVNATAVLIDNYNGWADFFRSLPNVKKKSKQTNERTNR